MPSTPESAVEEAALDWLNELGYETLHGGAIAPGEPGAERQSYGEAVLEGRLRRAVDLLNPGLPVEAKEEAVRRILRQSEPNLVVANRAFHHDLVSGVEVEVRRPDGAVGGERVRLIDFDDPHANDWLAVDQFTVLESGHERRPDIVVFVNGLPLAVFELKKPDDGERWFGKAFNQIGTYKAEIPALMRFNELVVLSDGLEARMGSLTAGSEWFKVWRSADGEREAPGTALGLETLLHGAFEKRRLLQLVRHYVAFEDDDESDAVHKILAGYHQFHAVNAAVEETVRASGLGEVEDGGAMRDRPGRFTAGPMRGGEPGDRRCGVVWHTQGSGKSLSMLFYAGRIVAHPAMGNPTLVVITDRNDLDDQLFGQFQRCHDTLRQMPVQAESREHLRELLAVASGGVVFATMQKFMPDNKGGPMPELSARRNVVVIADEAHRTQYDLIDGLARNLRDALPGASFIGFTGTPIEKADANTRAVFGDYVSVYDIQRAVADGSTVPIYYESRIARLRLDGEALPKLDADFEEVTEGEELERRERLKTKWAALEALVGDPKRIEVVARDLVEHFESRRGAMEGKAMVVCMSRRICVDLYSALVALRPKWVSAEDDADAEEPGACYAKVIMTGSASDPPGWQRHIRNKSRRKELAGRFKDSGDPFRIVIVRDMWLTGFDAPCLHTMYVDKPMRGHGLMQAIARVNRVFRDKPGGLVVDYLGLADQLKEALATYTEGGGAGQPTIDTADAVAALLEKYEVCCAMLHGIGWREAAAEAKSALKLVPEALEAILAQEKGQERFTATVADLSKAFALCAAHTEATRIRDHVAFFQLLAVKLRRPSGESRKTGEELDQAIRQIISAAIVPDGEVIDVFAAAGIDMPDISILSDEFLAEVAGMPQKNLAAELLRRLLEDEIKTRGSRNVVMGRLFSEMLKATMAKYHNRAIATQEVIAELIKLAKEMRDANRRGEDLGLNDDEIAFYDALAQNQSAFEQMGDDLKVIATELVTRVRESVTIDWTVRESARAKIRILVRRILRKHGYPPDLQEEATKLVLEQAKTLCAAW